MTIDVLKRLAQGDMGDIDVYIEDCNVEYSLTLRPELVTALTDAIRQLEWVKVSERLPEADCRILMMTKQCGMLLGDFNKRYLWGGESAITIEKSQFNSTKRILTLSEITHWKYAQPPESEEVK